MTLEEVIEAIMKRRTQSSNRLLELADFAKGQLALHGLPGAKGGSDGELQVHGLARIKDWDVAYEFAGKFRLLLSLKSMWKNVSGTIPNRLDDHMGEIANVQQLRPEIVIGFIVIFNVAEDSRRKDGMMWSNFFEAAIKKIAVRKAPLWNQGLLEASWFIRFDSRNHIGGRIVDREKADAEGELFFRSLIAELRLREPAIPFSEAAPPRPKLELE